MYVKVMLKKHVVAHTTIPRGAKIIVANHPSSSDPFIFTTLFGEQSSIFIYGNHFHIPVFGKYLRWSGHIPVIKGKESEAFSKAIRLLKEGKNVIVFIEGGLSQETTVKKPKTGAVRLALMTGAPIIPIGVGVKKRNMKHIALKIDKEIDEGQWYMYGPYAMTIGAPIYLKGDIEERNKVRVLSTYLMEEIERLKGESAERIHVVNHWIWKIPYVTYAYKPVRWAYRTMRNAL